MVPMTGIEPVLDQLEQDFESCVSAYSTTWALPLHYTNYETIMHIFFEFSLLKELSVLHNYIYNQRN